ncbi:MAG: hypothetical protein ACO3NB_09000, partial [Ilumatobacteraceae bacterium]
MSTVANDASGTAESASHEFDAVSGLYDGYSYEVGTLRTVELAGTHESTADSSQPLGIGPRITNAIPEVETAVWPWNLDVRPVRQHASHGFQSLGVELTLFGDVF